MSTDPVAITRQAIMEHAPMLLTAIREGEPEYAAELAAELAYEVTCYVECIDAGVRMPPGYRLWADGHDANIRKLAAKIMDLATRDDTAPMVQPGRIIARAITADLAARGLI